jgi:hypothetical protein
MKTQLRARASRGGGIVAIGLLLLALTDRSVGAETAKAPAVPPGSLVIRGSQARDKAPVTNTPQWMIGETPEHLFGLRMEQAARTNGLSIVARSFDLDALYRRFVPTLPTGEETKDRLLAAPRANQSLRRAVLQEAFVGIGSHVRFLGVRRYGQDVVLLFRDTDSPPIITHGGIENIGSAGYIAYVTERQPDGGIRLSDVTLLPGGELLSQSLRRRTIFELRDKKLLGDRLSASDQAWLTGAEQLRLFNSRCDYGLYNLIKEAYEKLDPELQNDRSVLIRFATSGQQSIKDIMVPVERWRRLYPTDPSPDLLVVDFYWRLYHGPREVREGPDKGIYAYAALAPQQEEEVAAAVAKANAWFEDPALEIKLASYYGGKRADKARPLLQQALKRFPLERVAYTELIKVDLTASNYVGVADSLHKQEEAYQTNLTAMVASRPEYEGFRKSFPWKQWQHDYHGVEAEKLAH